MTARTISVAYGSGVTLGAGDNPVTITASGSVTNSGGVALQAAGGVTGLTIDNSGTINATGAGATSIGISLTQGVSSATGTVVNYGGGLISGAYRGIYDAAAATVINNGAISAASATKGYAVLLGGGAVANTGVISGGSIGVGMTQVGGVTNTGSINGGSWTGILLNAGGAVFNSGAGSTITGYTSGVSVIGTGTVINQGVIAATKTVGFAYTYNSISGFAPQISSVIVGAGGISNAATGTISGVRLGAALVGAGSIQNAGLINVYATTTKTVGTVTNTYALGFGAWLFGGGTLTNAPGATIRGGFDAVIASGVAGASVDNQGFLTASRNAAIDLLVGGSATNEATGTIASGSVGMLERQGGTAVNAGSIGAAYGIFALSNPATATNSGTITSSSHNFGAGIQLKAGGVITNASGGVITGNWIGMQIGGFDHTVTSPSTIVYTYAPGGTVINAGTVIAHDLSIGNGAAVWIKGLGIILNQTGGTIAGGPYGVVSYDQVTVVNHGSISGSAFAVFASNPGKGDRVVVYPQAVFSGTVEGDKSGVVAPNGVLELANGTLAGTIAGFGSKYTGFSNVILDAGAQWSLGGTVTAGQTIGFAGAGAGLTLANPGSVAGTITGFGTGVTLALAGITDVTSATLGVNNLLSVVEAGGGTIALQLDPTQSFANPNFGYVVSGGATDITAPCFAAGTRIATAGGPVAVEALCVGMVLPTRFAGGARIVWLGHRRVDCTRHPRPHDVWPVRVHAGAFSPGVPGAELWLSPDHAVFAMGRLIPVRYLLNGRTIVQEQMDSITYYHIELAAHDVISAEGLDCESYLDTGNRGAFAGQAAPLVLHPDFARAVWARSACAPLAIEGPTLVALRAGLLERAAALGHRRTEDPALRLRARRRAVSAWIDGTRWHAALPPGTSSLNLTSRSWVPMMSRAEETDARRLGVALANITLDGRRVPLDDPRLTAGWHAPEPEWRWTDGAARIAVEGARTLAFDLIMGGTYWVERGRRAQAAAAS